MADYRNERWMEKDGSVFTVREYEMRSEFGANKKVYKVRGTIAFNVGKDLALHMVANQNHYLDNRELQRVEDERDQLIDSLQAELDILENIEYDDLTPEQEERVDHIDNQLRRLKILQEVI